MACGRLVFGLGAESLIVAVTTIMGKWFKGKELSFAFGLNLTACTTWFFCCIKLSKLGKAFYNNWQTPLFVSTTIATISIVSVIVYWGMDRYAEKKFILREVAKQDEIDFKRIFSFGKSYWYVVW